MATKCPICRGQGRVTLPLYEPLTVLDYEQTASVPRAQFETFDCPKCTKVVPYKRVRATKVISMVDAVEFAKFQVPMQRQLAARFGEYLLREGLIWFTTDNLDGNRNVMVEVSARCNVVDRLSGEMAGAESRMGVTVADVAAPENIKRQIARRKAGQSLREVNITALEPDDFVPEKIFEPESQVRRPSPRDKLRASREKVEAMGDRFSGLELDDDLY